VDETLPLPLPELVIEMGGIPDPLEEESLGRGLEEGSGGGKEMGGKPPEDD
jgi:hypothetical protein